MNDVLIDNGEWYYWSEGNCHCVILWLNKYMRPLFDNVPINPVSLMNEGPVDQKRGV